MDLHPRGYRLARRGVPLVHPYLTLFLHYTHKHIVCMNSDILHSSAYRNMCILIQW